MPTTDQTQAQLDRIMAMTPEELEAECHTRGEDPAQVAAHTRKVIDRAIRQAAHDRGDWMGWQIGEAWIHDGGTYEAEMVDGTHQMVTAEVYGEDEASLIGDDGEALDDDTVTRIRLA